MTQTPLRPLKHNPMQDPGPWFMPFCAHPWLNLWLKSMSICDKALVMQHLAQAYENLVHAVRDRSVEFYGGRLISFVLFGSVGRRVMRPDSDIDFLLVADPLPRGRMRRVEEFAAVEEGMREQLERARKAGIFASLSPVFKTPAEVCLGSPLFWDMLEDSRILYDRDAFFEKELDSLRSRLTRLGARRVWKGNAWYWDLKPDYKYGEEFEL